MSATGLVEPTAQDLRDALEGVLTPRLASLVKARSAGHCMRVVDADVELAAPLVRRLRGAIGPGAQICLLGSATDFAESSPLRDVVVSSTKLVELRNLSEDADSAHGPLLVFVPPGLRASAEDSFGVATFEDVSVANGYELLAQQLLEEVPPALRPGIDALLSALEGGNPRHTGARARARYLLTLKDNGYEQHAAGAALYHFGLVPDFELFLQEDNPTERVERNRELVGRLADSTRSERQRVLTLDLVDSDFAHRMASFAARRGLEDPLEWTRSIVVDRENWGLSFGNWKLEERRRSSVTIGVRELELPHAGDKPEHLNTYPALTAISGQPYLLAGPKGQADLTIRFTVEPDPRKVEGLRRFRVELISESAGPIGRATHVSVGRTAKSEYKAVLRKLSRIDWAEDWHYVKVTPLDDQGQALDVEPDGHGLFGGESERFYAVPDAETEEPPERSAGRHDGVVQALTALRLQALADGGTAERIALGDIRWKAGSGRSSQRTLSARFSAVGNVEIRLSPGLVELQQRMLASPDTTGLWHLPLTPAGPGEPVRDPDSGPAAFSDRAAEAHASFLEARQRYFAAIRGIDLLEGQEGLVTEARDLAAVHTELADYAQAYTELIAAQLDHVEHAPEEECASARVRLAQLLQTDCAAVSLDDGLGRRQTVLLVSPTHPLRALWLASWSALGREWTTRLSDAQPRQVLAARDSLMDGLTCLGFPFAVPRRDGQLMVAADALTPYWGAYLPSECTDPRGLLGLLTEALRLPAATSGSAATGLSGKQLADRVERYLRLHPYVRTLVANVVNAGRGDVLVDMLVELQRRPATRDLHYDLRLCVDDPQSPEAGEALAELLRAEAHVTAAEAEAFLTPATGARGAKLAFSVRALSEFTEDPASFDAHLTVLIDAFGGEQWGSAPRRDGAYAPVHGLVQATASFYSERDHQAVWRKTPRFGAARAVENAEDLTALLGRLPALTASAAGNVATAGRGSGHVPCTVLTLNTDDRALLYHAHQVSDWVVTIDRTLGLEYFDHAGAGGRPEYVIDYAPQTGGGLGHQILVSSKSVDELRALLVPVVRQHGIDVDQRHLPTFFDQLRLLSGNLAFKLASAASSQRTEVLGLSLARLYLDYQGVLRNQVVVPLDAHPRLYEEARRQASELGASLTFHRTDLALFHLDEYSRTITCNLVEVKCYTGLQDVGAYEQLKVRAAQQLTRSQEVLAAAFDPHQDVPDRVDRSAKNLELGTMLRFYLERARRHGTMDEGPHRSAHRLLDRLDDGYRLDFTRSGLIFDLARTGTGSEDDHAVEFHRIGTDLITELLEAIPTVQDKPVFDTDPGTDPDTDEGDTRPEVPTLAPLQLTVPRLTNAAFQAPTVSEGGPTGGEEQKTPVAAESGEPTAHADPQGRQPEPEDRAFAGGSDQEQPAQVGREPEETVSVDEEAHSVPGGKAGPENPAREPDVYVGVTKPSPQYGVLGDIAGRTVALDLNETHTISLFGVQGGGKSYTLGSIMEMASLSAPPVNKLPHPLATIVFHYSQTQDYAPEFTSMVDPNDEAAQLRSLRERYGAEPKALDDVLLLAPADQVSQRREEYPGIEVKPLTFSSSELQVAHWRFLMGAVGNQSAYIRQITRIMRAHRNNLSLSAIRQGVADSGLPDHLKQLARERLDLASDYIDDSARLTSLVRPGRLIIVDLRDELIEKDEALGLFVVLMQLFAEARYGERHFNKLVVFDEAHKYIDSPDLLAGLVETVREMRHKGMSVLVASQDPPSVPISLIELSDHIIMHKFTSPAWLKHLQKANAALSNLSPERMSRLKPGEAYLWASKATDAALTHSALRLQCRPRVTKHGGGTKTAGGG
jgi:hypothetical protein